MKNWWREIKRRRMYRSVMVARPMGLVFDIGANEGVKSRLFLSMGAKVIALEPEPGCAGKLQHLAQHHPKLKVLEMAVSLKKGTALLHIGNHTEISTLSSEMIQRYTVPQRTEWTSSIEVKTITLDELIGQYGLPDLLKLDCEGYDPAIIGSLRQAPFVIEFEFLSRFLEESLDAVTHIASLADYRFNFSPYENAVLATKHWMKAEEFREWLARHYERYIHGNIFARKQTKG